MRIHEQKAKKAKVLQALREYLGNVTTACKAAGISRKTFYKWHKEDTDFATEADEITDEQLDFVEDKLLQAINEGNVSAIIFYLKTKGRKRGYSERVDIGGVEEAPLQQVYTIRHIMGDPEGISLSEEEARRKAGLPLED